MNKLFLEIALLFNRSFRGSEREGDDLKNKYKKLKNVKKPTGDPSCPPEVVRAKRIQRIIEEKMDVQELGSEEDPHRNDDDDDGEFEEDFDVLINEFVAPGPVTQEAAPVPVVNNVGPQMPTTPAANYLHHAIAIPSAQTNQPISNAGVMTAQGSGVSSRVHSITNATSRVRSTVGTVIPRANHQVGAAVMRSGLSVDQLNDLQRNQNSLRSESPSHSHASSETSNRRRSLDAVITKATEAISSQQITSNDSSYMMMMIMNDAAQRRQDHEERAEKSRHEEQQRKEDREERERERIFEREDREKQRQIDREERDHQRQLEREEREQQRREDRERDNINAQERLLLLSKLFGPK